jgi:Domain of unknown function (DUF4168)
MDYPWGSLFVLFVDRCFNRYFSRYFNRCFNRWQHWLKCTVWLSLSVIVSLIIWFGAVPQGLAADLNGEKSPSISELGVPSRSGLDANAISSEKINQFVRAYLEVVALIERRESDLQSTETESESLQMQREIQTEALGLIESEGLTLQEYLQLLGLANIDPEFGERVAAQLQEASESI